jgi:hypothetical protein
MIVVVGEDGTLAIEAKPERLLVAHAAIAHSECRRIAPLMDQWITSLTGRQWKVIDTG